MESVTDTKIYKYTSEVVIEVMGVDSEGDFAVSSYQFSITADDSTVHPKGEVDLQHKSEIKTALEDAGYILEES